MQRINPNGKKKKPAYIDEAALLTFLTSLGAMQESEKLNFIASHQEVALAKPRLTMIQLSSANRKSFADLYVNNENIVNLAHSFEFDNEKIAFIQEHIDLVTTENLVPLAMILDNQDRFKFYQDHQAKITAENIYLIACSLEALDFGILLNQHTDKLNEKNFPALIGKFSLLSVTLADHVKFIQAVMPLLEKTHHNMIKGKIELLQRELKTNIKANRKGVLFLQETDSRKLPLEVLQGLLVTAEAILKALPLSLASLLSTIQPTVSCAKLVAEPAVTSSTSTILHSIAENSEDKKDQLTIVAAKPDQGQATHPTKQRQLWKKPETIATSRPTVVPSSRIFDSPRPADANKFDNQVASSSQTSGKGRRGFHLRRSGAE